MSPPDLAATFGASQPIVGMVHLAALPGSPGYDRGGGLAMVVDGAAADIEALQAGGIDAVLFGNESDRPYELVATTEGAAAMAAVVTALRPLLTVPFGVDYLWDPVATVAIACATEARFAREVFTGVYASDMGTWEPDARGALRLRAELGRQDLPLLFNVNAEFATPLDRRPIGLRARSAVFSSLADVVCVSGPLTGDPVATSDLEAVRSEVGGVPVFANTGVTIDNVAEILSVANGAVVGTHLKVDGVTWNPIDPARVGRFMDRVRTIRGS